MYERVLLSRGNNHLTFDTVNSLGVLYTDQDKLDKAEEMFNQALQGYEKLHGRRTRLSKSGSLYNLGLVYQDQGKLDEAEKMFKRAQQGFEELQYHRWTYEASNNLGLVYQAQGKLDEAEKMFKRAIQGYEFCRITFRHSRRAVILFLFI